MKRQKIREINPRRLYYFREVIKQGSLSKAAWNLGTSPSVVTRQIDLLENELGGVRLFERRQSAGTKPTEAAQIVVQYCQRNYANLDALEQDLNAWRDMKKGDISIAVPAIYVNALMVHVVNPFHSEYSDINICINEINASPQIETEVLEDTAHIGITTGLSNDANIHSYANTPHPVSLLVGKTHPLAKKQKVKFSEVARYPLALFPDSFRFKQIVSTAAHEAGVQLTPILVTSSFAAQKKMVYLNSDCATFSGPLGARQEIETDQLKAIEIDSPIFQSMQTHVIVRQNRILSPAVRQLLRILSAQLPTIERYHYQTNLR